MTRLIELCEALHGLLSHVTDGLVLGVNVCLSCPQVMVHLVYFLEAGHLAVLIINNIFLLFLNVVDRGLNLGCQVLL